MTNDTCEHDTILVVDPRFPDWCGLESFGGGAPVQGEGLLPDGVNWYFRARHDSWSMNFYAPDDNERPFRSHSERYGANEFDASWMPYDVAIKFIVREISRYLEDSKK